MAGREVYPDRASMRDRIGKPGWAHKKKSLYDTIRLFFWYQSIKLHPRWAKVLPSLRVPALLYVQNAYPLRKRVKTEILYVVLVS